PLLRFVGGAGGCIRHIHDLVHDAHDGCVVSIGSQFDPRDRDLTQDWSASVLSNDDYVARFQIHAVGVLHLIHHITAFGACDNKVAFASNRAPDVEAGGILGWSVLSIDEERVQNIAAGLEI